MRETAYRLCARVRNTGPEHEHGAPSCGSFGLVGAAVSDHPRIVDIVNKLADDGREVGLSSLRPDRLKDEFVGALNQLLCLDFFTGQ